MMSMLLMLMDKNYPDEDDDDADSTSKWWQPSENECTNEWMNRWIDENEEKDHVRGEDNWTYPDLHLCNTLEMKSNYNITKQWMEQAEIIIINLDN